MKASPNNMHFEYFWPATEPVVCSHAATMAAGDTNTNTPPTPLEETVRYS